MAAMTVTETVLNELERLTGTDQVRKDPHVDLFGHKTLLEAEGFVASKVSKKRTLALCNSITEHGQRQN